MAKSAGPSRKTRIRLLLRSFSSDNAGREGYRHDQLENVRPILEGLAKLASHLAAAKPLLLPFPRDPDDGRPLSGPEAAARMEGAIRALETPVALVPHERVLIVRDQPAPTPSSPETPPQRAATVSLDYFPGTDEFLVDAAAAGVVLGRNGNLGHGGLKRLARQADVATGLGLNHHLSRTVRRHWRKLKLPER
jgi:hypothetical protein